MSSAADLKKFINDPNTVDFIVRRSKTIDNYIASNPNIRTGPTFTGDYQIVFMHRDMLHQTKNDLGIDVFSGYSLLLTLLGKESLEDSGIMNVQNQPYLNLKGNGVLIGFVDTGIDYTLPDFKYEDNTTKIRYIWDQTIPDNSSDDYFLGTEYTSEDINAALRADDPYSVVPHKDTNGHGTFLASQAAGRETDSNIGAAPDAELIVVKLRKAREFYLNDYMIPRDQENVYESSFLMGGIDYIYKKSQDLGMPVVICIGLGTNMSGHEGSDLLSEYLSGLSHRTGVCICTAAGNESQARHHTQGVITKDNGTENIEINVGLNGGNIVLDVWNHAADRVSFSLKSPTGEVVSRIPFRINTRYETKLILEKSVITIEYNLPIESGGGMLSLIKITDCIPGIWIITMHGDVILDGAYHAWLPITGLGSPEVDFLNPSPNGTITVPGTAIGVITCGAYDNFTDSLYIDSSWGPTRLPSMSPNLVAPGVGVTGAYPQGRMGTMTGTSVSTAITAGACALMMQWGVVEKNDVSLNTYRIKAYLIRGCTQDENRAYPDFQWGYGELNLYNSFRSMQ